MKNRSQYVLGLSISHDATAVLMNGEGQVLAGIGEERLTRQKYHETFPFQGIKWLLQYTNIRGTDITEVAYNWRNIGGSRPYRENIFSLGKDNVDWANDIPMSVSSQVAIDWLLKRFRLYHRLCPKVSDAKYVRRSLNECGVTTKNVTPFDHQLCHASSAFFGSDLKKSLVISIDGYGDEKSGGIYIGENNTIRRVEEIMDDVSAGAFYANVTGALGFKRNRHEGKITGLAASGESSRCEDLLRRYFDLGDDLRFLRSLNIERDKTKEFLNMLRYFCNGQYGLTDDYFQLMNDEINNRAFRRQDVAAAAQAILEDVVSRMIDDRMTRYHCDHLAVAGGVFANVKLNQKLCELKSVKKFFVHPNMGDGGGRIWSRDARIGSK